MAEILVVDDDRDVAHSIELALRRREFRVTLAYSGERRSRCCAATGLIS
jgi:DNA-binding response OmpR family regulator